ncbi:MAG: Gfo/Idh/MocA family oxidoreductase [Clostridia bacterium]|nr:Gfo/Idh/MocA family oxidoreductase [Clostridia bacterium]
MIKIGILGTDNSHADEFSRLANDMENGKYLYEDVRVTHVFGHDKTETEELAKKHNIPNIVKDPAEMLGEVDAVMVVFRDGIYHYRYAEPFIKAGIPVWVDKPITIDPAECKKMIELAKEYNCPLSGGSNCKYADDIQSIKKYVESRKLPIASAMINFSLQIDSIYSGFYFYASHCVEMATAIFGYDVKSVTAHRNNTSVNAVFEYDKFDVHLGFLPVAGKYSCYLLERLHNTKIDIEINDIAEHAFDDFVRCIRERTTTYPMEDLLKSVVLMNATYKAFNERKTVDINYNI